MSNKCANCSCDNCKSKPFKCHWCKPGKEYIVSYRMKKEDPVVTTCVYHRNPRISEDKFIEIVQYTWYERGKQEGSDETRNRMCKDLEDTYRKKSWW